VSVDLSVTLSGLSRLYGGDLAALVETARIADAEGIHQICMTDHLVMGPHTERYPYGRFPFPPDEPWPEPLTTLAAMAGATSHIRLATGILIVPLRPAVLLAKTLATLDVLSRGRLEIAVGTGWQREEFDAAGVPFAARGERMMDALRACRALWAEAPASFTSETVHFENVWCVPRPAQPNGIPLWFGQALGPRTLERMVELDAGWAPIVASREELVGGVTRLQEARTSAGLPPTPRVRAAAPLALDTAGAPDLDATLARVSEAGLHGITVASLALAAFARGPDEVRPFLERVGRAARS